MVPLATPIAGDITLARTAGEIVRFRPSAAPVGGIRLTRSTIGKGGEP